MGWQPIETAPKDGTPILVVWRTEPPTIELVRYVEPDRGWHDEWLPTVFGGCEGEIISFATDELSHWMPLPPSPDRSGEAIETTEIGSTEGESRISS